MKAGVNYVGVGVGAIVMKETGEVLMNKRGPESNNERGLWEFPGGTVDYGFTLAETVVKEVKEETGVDVVVEKILGAFDHILKGEGQHWVNHVFLTKYIGGEISIPESEKEKIVDCQWMKMEDVENLDLTQASRDTLSAYYEVFPKKLEK